jgi:hypothetical protein
MLARHVNLGHASTEQMFNTTGLDDITKGGERKKK